MKHRTPAYWPMRITLAAVLLLPVVLLGLLALRSWPPMTDGWLATIAVGIALWLIGVVWMLRIFRGPVDELPPWRYRDR